MSSEDKIVMFDELTKRYLSVTIELLDYSVSKKILPLKLVFAMNVIKQYINNNKVHIIQLGVSHLLDHKQDILNFSISNLDELDDESDNISKKKCINNINSVQDKLNLPNQYCEYDILNIIIEIKNNAKVLCNNDKEIIKKYIELLIIILENIKRIFV